MKARSIEQALAWAYGDQKVHLAREDWKPKELGRSFTPQLAAMDFGADYIDSSTHFEFEAHPDAYLLHDAVQSLVPVRVERTREEVEMMVARRAFGEQITAGGAMVDLSYHVYDENGDASVEHLPGSALAELRRQVMVMPLPELRPAGLILQAAVTAKRPDPILDPMYIPERGRAIFTDARRRAGYRIISWVGEDALKVIGARRAYAVWWQALAAVREAVAGRIVSFTINAEMPPGPFSLDPT